MISQRTKASLAAAKARGKKLGNPNYQEALARARAALGYRPPAQEVLDQMAAWRWQGDTLRRIAERLNAFNNRHTAGLSLVRRQRARRLHAKPSGRLHVPVECQGRKLYFFCNGLHAGARGHCKRRGCLCRMTLGKPNACWIYSPASARGCFVVTKLDVEQRLKFFRAARPLHRRGLHLTGSWSPPLLLLSAGV